MPAPYGFKPADYGEDHEQLVARRALRRITIDWKAPRQWRPSDEGPPLPSTERRPGFLYALSWDHHLASRRETIAYIGITEDLATRFLDHRRAKELLARKRKTFIAVGDVDFGRRVNPDDGTRRVIEELEHILIWALWGDQELLNERKVLCMPGFGTRGGEAWHIMNTGYRFRGQMPREIIYPWMLVKPGRNRASRAQVRSSGSAGAT